MMKLLVGLGNPGSRYELTRHNAGFLVLDQICESYGVSWDGRKFSSDFAKGCLENVPCICLKPQTFMNLSGKAVREAMSFYKIAVEDLIVFQDDIDIPASKVRAKIGGGHGGHNGIRSIVKEISSSDFLRIKIGVGRPDDGSDVADWVLGRFRDQELDDLAESMMGEVQKRLKSFLTDK